MNSKEIFIRVWDREFRTTVRVLQAFRADQLDAKPHEQSRSVRSLAWQCVIDEQVIGKILDGQNDLRNVPPGPPPPDSLEAIIAAYQTAHQQSVGKMKRISESDFSRTVTVLLRGGQWLAEQPETLWGNVLDQVHHRGQLTVYLRLAGGKVPSIYGPSGDEPMPSYAGQS